MASTSAVARAAAAAASAGVESPLRQYKSLMLKHALLARRNVISTTAQLFIGTAVCLMLVLFQNIANVVLSASTLHPGESPISDIPACTPGPASVRVDGNGSMTARGACNTVMYAPSTPAIDALMARIASDNGVDVVPFPGATRGPPFDLSLANVSASTSDTCVVGACATRPTLECLPCDLLRDNLTLTNYMLSYPNSTQNAVWFLGAYLDVGDLSYSIFYNISVTQAPFFGDAHTTAVKRALDRAFLASAAPDAAVTLDIGSRKFPTPTPRLAGYDVFSANGGQWLFVVPCILFFSILVEIVSEKEGRLRVSMRQMGMRTPAFWAAWLSYGLTMSTVATAILEVSGYACGFTFFRNASGAVTFLLFLLFSCAMLSLAILLSTLITSARTAQTVGYSFILIGFVFQFILTSAYAGLVDLLYSTTVADWVVSVRNLLRLYPAYNFSLMFYDISNQAGSVLDLSAGRIVAGPGFEWSDMYSGRTRTFAGFVCNLPAPVQSVYFLLLDIVVFITLALYLDAVLPGPHGSPAHPLFFLGFTNTPTSRSAPPNEAALMDSERAGVRDVGVMEEEVAAAEASADVDVVVRISHMRVVYRKGVSAYAACLCGTRIRDSLAATWTGFVAALLRPLRSSNLSMDTHYTELTSPQRDSVHGGRGNTPRAVDNAGADKGAGDVTAVEDLSLLVRRNEIVALLGHNGAGKTTTVQVLTGLFRSTSGTATVCGLDVNENTAATQRVTGVCPQHSILWPLLTPRETLRLYCAIKGITPEQTEGEIDRVLAQVRLLAVADKMVGTFSGGMARRCSLAIAALGSPKVIYLDEPTTGLDPVTRQQVWHLIQRLRENAAVVLTTHDMAEANALATRVAIMAHGKLVALGSPLRLKHAYGAGYRLNVTMVDALPATLERVQQGIHACAPSAALTLRDAATASFTIPFSALEAMPRVLEWADAVSAQPAASATSAPARLIEDFGVSGPSLESVFIAVSAAARFDMAQETAAVGEELANDAASVAPQATLPAKSATENDAVPRSAPRSYGYRALCIKNGTIILRQRGLCICQLLTPLIVLMLLVLLQRIIKAEAGEFRIQQLPSLPLPLNMNQFYPVTNSYSPGNSDDDDLGAMAPQLTVNDIISAVTERQYASFGDTPDPKSAGVFADVVHLSLSGQPPSCTSSRSHGAAIVSIVRELLGVIPCADSVAHAEAAGGAAALLAANRSTSYNTDCLTFFLHTSSARDSSVNATALAEIVGGLPRVIAPPLAPGQRPAYTPANISVNASGMLQYVRSSWCTLRNATLVNAPFFAQRWPLSSSDMDIELMSDAVILNNVSTSLLDIQAPCWNASGGQFFPAQESASCPAYILPDATIDFHDVGVSDVAALRLAYTLQVNDLSTTTYHRPSNFSRLGLLSLPRWASSLSLTVDPARLSVMDSLTRAFAAQVDETTAPEAAPGPFTSALPAVVVVSTFPMLSVTNLLQFVEIVGAVLHPIVLSLQLPLFIFITVLEKEERLIELQRAMGLRYAPYIAVTYGLNMAMYSAVSLLFALAGRWLQFTFFTQTSATLLFLAFTGWGLALCSLAMLVSTFLWSRTGATVVGYAVALFGNLVAIIVCAGIYGANPLSLGQALPRGFYVVPMFGFVRFLYLGTYNCIAKVQCYTDVRSALAPGSEVRAAVGSLYLCALFYLVLALYLDQVLPRRFGVRKPLLFFVPAWAWRACARTSSGSEAARSGEKLSLNGSADGGNYVRHAYVSRWSGHAQLSEAEAAEEYCRGEDADVQAARVQVARMMALRGAPTSAQVTQFPVILHHLRKEFDVTTEVMHALRRTAAAARGLVTRMGLLQMTDTEDVGGVAPLLHDRVASINGGSVSGGSVNGGSQHVMMQAVNSLDGVQLDAEQAAMSSAGVKVAVSDCTLAIAQGVTFGVLGENGSGKSTTANMLQGLLEPTAGDAWVNGFHIVRDTDAVRLSLSIVPQHDALWSDLTISEHLYFYARLKGVAPDDLTAAVSRAATEVGLAAFSQRYAGDLSGGMRRRLSLALALVGNSRIVIADEPCTGLDAASRRVIWRILERARANRVIILISHDMAEVEALANEIGIMTYGRLRCLGTQQALKSRYGGGFVLQINHTCSPDDATAFVTGSFEGAQLESQFTGYMSFRVPIAAGMSRMFRVMAQEAAGVGITDWAVQQVSLDTVFKRIVRHYRGGVRTVDDAWDDE